MLAVVDKGQLLTCEPSGIVSLNPGLTVATLFGPGPLEPLDNILCKVENSYYGKNSNELNIFQGGIVKVNNRIVSFVKLLVEDDLISHRVQECR
jgi:hypothetical protein